MVTLNAEQLADLIAELIGDHVDKVTAPLVARIAELERAAQVRAALPAPKPRVRVPAAGASA